MERIREIRQRALKLKKYLGDNSHTNINHEWICLAIVRGELHEIDAFIIEIQLDDTWPTTGLTKSSTYIAATREASEMNLQSIASYWL